MRTIPEIQEEIKNEFDALPDNDHKWKHVIGLARSHEAIDESLKEEKFLVKGCATRLFLIPKFEDGFLKLFIDTDSGGESPLIVRGLASLAHRLYNGQSPKDILGTDPAFFQEIGLTVALSATRANGFASMLKQIYMYAQVYAAMSK
ncbi:MAG: SufE family protein [Fibrobacterales bacterium]